MTQRWFPCLRPTDRGLVSLGFLTTQSSDEKAFYLTEAKASASATRARDRFAATS